MHLFSIALSNASLLFATFANPSADVIRVEETGVADNYSATKRILCGNVDWRIEWKSLGRQYGVTGEVLVLVDGVGKSLSDIDRQVFSQFATVESISATCNPGQEGSPTRTALSVLGYSKSGARVLARGTLEPSLDVNWTLDRL